MNFNRTMVNVCESVVQTLTDNTPTMFLNTRLSSLRGILKDRDPKNRELWLEETKTLLKEERTDYNTRNSMDWHKIDAFISFCDTLLYLD